jgi:hypothetical protein
VRLAARGAHPRMFVNAILLLILLSVLLAVLLAVRSRLRPRSVLRSTTTHVPLQLSAAGWSASAGLLKRSGCLRAGRFLMTDLTDNLVARWIPRW